MVRSQFLQIYKLILSSQIKIGNFGKLIYFVYSNHLIFHHTIAKSKARTVPGIKQ